MNTSKGNRHITGIVFKFAVLAFSQQCPVYSLVYMFTLRLQLGLANFFNAKSCWTFIDIFFYAFTMTYFNFCCFFFKPKTRHSYKPDISK